MNRGTAIIFGMGALLAGQMLYADDTSRPEFETEVAPILAEHCQKCHGAEKPKSGLDVTSSAALLRGGESGPAVVPGQAEKSLLLEMIAGGQMPPEGEKKLSDEQVGRIRRWITSGAAAAVSAEPPESAPKTNLAGGEFWAFRRLSPPGVPPLPALDGAARTTVDAFVLAKLQEHGLRYAPQADRLTLLRRACYDLVGLPPTPEQIDAFAADNRPDAYERLLDQLLASPHFGERWGRHWLDAAGYSDITGGDNDAAIIKLSDGKWKYRDWVVRAFNEDRSYERFLIDQLAGDEVVDWRNARPFTPEILDRLIATGFLRNAADDTDEKELTTQDILHGILQRTSEVVANNLLGLTLGCAKCHDHKYEPIAQQDYYRLLAAFSPTYNPAAWLPPKQRALADISPGEKADAEKHNVELDRAIGELTRQRGEIQRPGRESIFERKLASVPEAIRADVKPAIQTAADKRSEVQKYLADKFQPSLGASDDEVLTALGDGEKRQIGEFDQRIVALKPTHRAWGTIQAAYDAGPPPTTHLLRRGNHETPGPAVDPGFIAVLCSKEPAAASGLVTAPLYASTCKPAGPTSGRRLALARWLTDWNSPAGGLAARVFVNRVWQHLFGRGIVETSENLGLSGAAPSHAELLEWLTCHFVAEGRQVKPLIKLLMTSGVYRQASRQTGAAGDATTAESDPANRLLTHMPLRRLEAEIVRDAILSVSGQLDLALGGPPVPVEVRADGMVVIPDKNLPTPGAKSRRSVYVLARRNYHLSMLNVFDQPTMATNCPNRQQSAVVLQSLAMLNDAFVLEQADRFAARVRAAAGAEAVRQIELAFRIALAREPSAREIAWSQELLAGQIAECAKANLPGDQVAQQALAHLCHMLLNANEFLYVP